VVCKVRHPTPSRTARAHEPPEALDQEFGPDQGFRRAAAAHKCLVTQAAPAALIWPKPWPGSPLNQAPAGLALANSMQDSGPRRKRSSGEVAPMIAVGFGPRGFQGRPRGWMAGPTNVPEPVSTRSDHGFTANGLQNISLPVPARSQCGGQPAAAGGGPIQRRRAASKDG